MLPEIRPCLQSIFFGKIKLKKANYTVEAEYEFESFHCSPSETALEVYGDDTDDPKYKEMNEVCG